MNAEGVSLEAALNSGTMDHMALTAAAQRIQQLIAAIDTAELRLLELMELM